MWLIVVDAKAKCSEAVVMLSTKTECCWWYCIQYPQVPEQIVADNGHNSLLKSLESTAGIQVLR